VHPFDLRTALFARHAQHVVLIHFPIALFIAGVGFDFLAKATRQQRWAMAAYCNFLAAALTTLPVVATGILAWRWALEGQRLKGVLLMHLVLGCLSSVLIWMVWLIHFRSQRKQDPTLPSYRLPVEVMAVLVVMATGHLGGFLSGVNGPG
jgi:uncharacterized membrane protein